MVDNLKDTGLFHMNPGRFSQFLGWVISALLGGPFWPWIVLA